MTTSALMTFLVLVITVLLLFGLYGHLLPSVAMPTQDKVHTGFSGGTGLSFLTLVFSQRPKVFSAMEEGQHVWTRLWQTCSHALYTKIHDLIHNIWQCDVSVLETYMPAQPDVFSLCMKSHSLCSPPVCPLTPCSIISNKTECWPCCDSQGFQRAEEACYTHSNGKEDPFKTPSQNMVGMSQARWSTLPHDLARCIQEVYTGAVALLSDQLVDGAKELKDLYLYFVSSCKHYLFNWMPSQTTPPAKRCHDDHVSCPEDVPSMPVQSVQDGDSRVELCDRAGEERLADTRSSYDVGLAAERSASLRAMTPQDSSQLKDQVIDAEKLLTEDNPVQIPDPEGSLEPELEASSEPLTLSPADDLAGTYADASEGPSSQIPSIEPASLSEASLGDTLAASLADPEQPATGSEPVESPLFYEALHSTENAIDRNEIGSETKTSVDGLLETMDENATVLDHGRKTSEEVNEQATDTSGSKEDPSVPSKDHGDIPTFDEWKKKMMEVEKSQSTHTSSSGGSPVIMKKVQNFNNYASVECGAKILAANTEAKSTSAILMENMDLYMLNPCSNKIWFVIELCEPIQVKQLDIANFELFSSTPKDFLVSISDRYPTNKWIKLGTFHARDKRTVQSFPLDEQLYAKYVKMFIKYIKVELLSHFGSEHFCPLSLIRVFGTSMVEEYEEIAESQYPSEKSEDLDEDHDYPPSYMPLDDQSSKNLIHSATDAILNMVNNIAANVLGAPPKLEDGASSQASESAETVNVNEMVPPNTPTSVPESEAVEPGLPVPLEEPESPATEEPQGTQIVTLVEDDDAEEEEGDWAPVTSVENGKQGVELVSSGEGFEVRQWDGVTHCGQLSPSCCTTSLLEYLRQQCSSRLTFELQEHYSDAHSPPNPQPDPSMQPQEPLPKEEVGSTQGEVPGPMKTVQDGTRLIGVLEPSLSTSTMTVEIISDESSTKELPEQVLVNQGGIPDVQEGEVRPGPSSEISTSISNVSEEAGLDSDQWGTLAPTPTQVFPPVHQTTESLPASEVVAPLADSNRTEDVTGEPQQQPPSTESQEPPQPVLDGKLEESLEDLLSMTTSNGQGQRTASDFYAEQNSSDLAYTNGNHMHGSNQKESIFMRLSNRIKALEMNVSLSGRYLEELSQRYRKQMDEMQKAFNNTIIKLQNTSRMAEEQDQKQTESIQLLQSQLHNVSELLLNLSTTVHSLQREASDWQTYLFVSLSLSALLGLLLLVQCCRGSAPPLAEPNESSVLKRNIYQSPKRCFSSYDDMSLIRKVPCPLVRSKSVQLSPARGPDDLYIVEPLKFSPGNRKKKHCSPMAEPVETLRPSIPPYALLNGGPKCNGLSQSFPRALAAMDPASEGSSEGSSHSEESYFCGISACTRLCDGQPPTRGKRAIRRRRSRPGEPLVRLPPNMALGGAAFQVPAVSGPV